MDAYVFAATADSGAISTLISGVGSGGPARVVCPLTGDKGIYVAVEANDSTTLSTRIAQVVATNVLTGTTAHVGTSSPATFPTHAVVGTLVGFTMLTAANTGTVASAAAAINGVIGVAVTNGSSVGVLVESTADDTTTLASIMSDVADISGASVEFTATGTTANGAGF